MKQVLQELDATDDVVTIRDGLTQHGWPERIQRDASHDTDMWNAIVRACAQPLPEAN